MSSWIWGDVDATKVCQMNGIRPRDISTSQHQMERESFKDIRAILASHCKRNAHKVHSNERDL